jgi:holo-[acyl-carrier protein] synthase
MDDRILEIKKIVAFFIGVNPEGINNSTIIDKSILKGSIRIHIMYGELADNGFKIKDYNNIKTFGQLLSRLELLDDFTNSIENIPSASQSENEGTPMPKEGLIKTLSCLKPNGIGIDIVKKSKMPVVADFRESAFYSDNFSLGEISHCLVSHDPYNSFAGRFAAKEAIVKADNNYKNTKFRDIDILIDQNGKPYFDNFIISISYEDDYALAVAYISESDHVEVKTDDLLKVRNDFNEKLNISEEKLRLDIKSNFLKKSFMPIVIFSLILNLLLCAYLIVKYFE